jgi:capsular polysaccharide biosynthesis protein
MVGIDIDRTIEWSGGIAHFSQLVIGSVRYHTASEYDGYIHSPAAMARLGDRIRTAVSSSSTGTRRIYVSRADAADRRILNESELMSVLNKYGFERIVPGSLSFEEQVQTFADAEIILGPHGAGLTNIIFADETTLVELFGSYQNACFFTLAQGVGHEYVSVMCRSNGSDMVVDVDTIEAVVDDVV